MIALFAAALVATTACPTTEPRTEILALHEATRNAHLQGDPGPIADAAGQTLLLAENGGIRTQTRAEVASFFSSYFKRVKYREWRDVTAPVVTVSPDGQMAWMAVAVEARYVETAKPDAGEKAFTSSWIATYARDNCAWKMTAIASDIAAR